MSEGERNIQPTCLARSPMLISSVLPTLEHFAARGGTILQPHQCFHGVAHMQKQRVLAAITEYFERLSAPGGGR